MQPARHRDAQRLMVTGLLGRATVLAAHDTGRLVNDAPQIAFDLLVTVEGQPPYRVTHRQAVSPVVIENFRPGASIPVRIDPSDPTHVLIG